MKMNLKNKNKWILINNVLIRLYQHKLYTLEIHFVRQDIS